MRRVYGEELKAIQMQILDVVTQFCEENHIRYWLDGGTLLGAIRHKGYIPWDDDIDIGMLRPDYDRFMSLFNRSNTRYQFRSGETDPQFCFAFGKVLDTNTVLYEPDRRGHKHCINIDIFVYDNTPDKATSEKMYARLARYQRYHERRFANYKARGNAVRRVFAYALRSVVKLFPKNYFVQKMIRNSKQYSHMETEFVGNFTSVPPVLCHKRIFDSFIDGEFEGKTYKIPVGYDEWLRAFYGDYMQLPPVEKQVSHHSFEAYVPDGNDALQSS